MWQCDAVLVQRTGEIIHYERHGIAYTGARGLLVIGPISFPTCEIRTADGEPYLYLREATYLVEMAHMRNASQRPALRFLRDGLPPNFGTAKLRKTLEDGRLYAHDLAMELIDEGARAFQARRTKLGDELELRVDYLAGCIGVGLWESPCGVLGADRAMAQVFHALGGWELGKRFKLEVFG